MIVAFTAARLVLVSAGLLCRCVPSSDAISVWFKPRLPDGLAKLGGRRPELELPGPDSGSGDDVTSSRWRGCGRQADLVLPDQVENTLSIVWVDGEDVGRPPPGCFRQWRGLTEVWPGVLV
jgi:hypothetical protein